VEVGMEARSRKLKVDRSNFFIIFLASILASKPNTKVPHSKAAFMTQKNT